MVKLEKLVKDSQTTMTELIMPNDTNPLGNLMGGNLMRWMDMAAAICASRHCEAHAVTASVDHVSFQNPIRLGDVITLSACVTRAFNSSVEVYVEVTKSDIKGGNTMKSNHAYFTFVALDDITMKPQSVPAVRPVTSEETTRYEGASRRRELRLILSGRIKPQEAKEIRSFFQNL
ncbi:MAG TPA: acyl-CoA thioesterase [Saprospiraceae bacterium]|nr:acyl-CoA thioesterase [Saprospiraceae bacterium]